VETPVGRIVVFPGAVLAHRERRHRGERPVIGHVAHDGETGTAVGAVDERIAEPAVGRISQLTQAVPARGGICRDQGVAPAAGVAGYDVKTWFAGRSQRLGPHLLDDGQRRRLHR
jgi:hypothetical protein